MSEIPSIRMLSASLNEPPRRMGLVRQQTRFFGQFLGPRSPLHGPSDAWTKRQFNQQKLVETLKSVWGAV
jgi:hypothetical protein